MPELPEAETIARGLAARVTGCRIAGVEVLHADVVEGDPAPFRDRATGRRIDQVTRRGKNVVLVLDGGTRLVVNLGMSGRLLARPGAGAAAGATAPSGGTEAAAGRPTFVHEAPPTHPAVRFPLDGDAGVLVYHDVRRFGRLRILEPADYRAWSRSLGPEPLGRRFTGRWLAEALGRSVSPVRSWLLDQRRVAGVGNIYANEALHRAGIHPATPAGRIPTDAAARLHRALRRVLREAIRRQGTTLRDYRGADGSQGSYAVRLRVYGKKGEPCPACGTAVERVVFGNRSAFYCPGCQPAP